MVDWLQLPARARRDRPFQKCDVQRTVRWRTGRQRAVSPLPVVLHLPNDDLHVVEVDGKPVVHLVVEQQFGVTGRHSRPLFSGSCSLGVDEPRPGEPATGRGREADLLVKTHPL